MSSLPHQVVRFDLKYTDSTTILFVKRASELQLFVPPGERECTEIEEHLESALGMPDRCSAALQIAYDRLAAPSVAVAEDDCKRSCSQPSVACSQLNVNSSWENDSNGDCYATRLCL